MQPPFSPAPDIALPSHTVTYVDPDSRAVALLACLCTTWDGVAGACQSGWVGLAGSGVAGIHFYFHRDHSSVGRAQRLGISKVLSSNPTFSKEYLTCLSPAVGGLKCSIDMDKGASVTSADPVVS